MAKPQISIIVTTYERPDNLRRVLASIAGQRGVDGNLEVIVADDGSRDETRVVVQRFRRQARFPVRFVTHEHRGFCPGRCRNEGVAASEAEYLLLLDGDCLIPPDHVRIHLDRRRRGIVRMGDCLRLSQAASSHVTDEMAIGGKFQSLASSSERWRLRRRACSTWWYNARRHPGKPALIGNNLGLWREDYERVNGFDENYVGWGCEDDDFGKRLRRAGVRLESILWWTNTYHLWHPIHPTAPARWSQGPNVEYYRRGFRLTRCGNGLTKRSPRDIALRRIGPESGATSPRHWLPNWCRFLPPDRSQTAEVEVLLAPSDRSFSGKADCNVLVVPDVTTRFSRQYSQAHLVVANQRWPQVSAERQFALHEFELALQYLLTNTRSAPRSVRIAA
jgi:glycosyltransferase involved in cell wall biosynthesis